MPLGASLRRAQLRLVSRLGSNQRSLASSGIGVSNHQHGGGDYARQPAVCRCRAERTRHTPMPPRQRRPGTPPSTRRARRNGSSAGCTARPPCAEHREAHRDFELLHPRAGLGQESQPGRVPAQHDVRGGEAQSRRTSMTRTMMAGFCAKAKPTAPPERRGAGGGQDGRQQAVEEGAGARRVSTRGSTRRSGRARRAVTSKTPNRFSATSVTSVVSTTRK